MSIIWLITEAVAKFWP